MLAACATTQAPSASSQQSTSDYTANRRADGAVEIIVTAMTAAPTKSSEATLQLGDMLRSAAAKECPNGYDLTQDKEPNVRVNSDNKLVATFRGSARCK